MRLCDEGGSSILGVKEHFLWVLDAPIQEKYKWMSVSYKALNRKTKTIQILKGNLGEYVYNLRVSSGAKPRLEPQKL